MGLNIKHRPDSILLGISIALLFAGILILASVSSSFSLDKFGTTFYFLNHQILLGLIPGLLAGTIAFFIPLELFRKFSLPFLLANMVLLVVVFLPVIGSAGQAAFRWIYLGPLSFQPSELLKLTLILYIAAWLASKKERTLLPFITIMGIIGLFLYLQPDISTLGIIGVITVMMYFMARTPVWHTFFMIGGGFAALIALIQIAPYRASRLAVFLDPSLDPLGKGYQVKQALIGIGSGGLTGVGLGLSFQKFGILPEPVSDSIFAVFSEEVGFIGSFLLVALFLAFAWRALVIARRTDNFFASLVAVGITTWITIQAFVNIGAMIGILPLTGIPLPFISYGGSALVTELLAIGILLNISKRI